VTAIIGGLLGATCWGVSSILAGRAARGMGSVNTLAWVALIGAVVVLPLLIVEGLPTRIDTSDLLLLAVGAAGSVIGLGLTYRALAIGKVGVVVAITSTEGAIGAAFAIVAGERLGGLTGVGLVFAAFGVVVVALGRHASDSAATVRGNRRAAVFAGSASTVFGASLWASGDVATRIGSPLLIFTARILGVVTIALPLIVRGRLPVRERAVPFAIGAGVVEILGFLSFLWGASESIAVAAVLATQYAVVATILSWILFHERLSRTQLGGIGVVIGGVILVSLGQVT
jgi:drug/metabolite transporter (DMT)-like permease